MTLDSTAAVCYPVDEVNLMNLQSAANLATEGATWDATRSAARDATWDATRVATMDAIEVATSVAAWGATEETYSQ